MKDLKKYAFLFWLIVITSIYIYTSLKWLLHPLNKSPYDYLFSLILVGAMVAVSLLSVILREKSYIIPFFLGSLLIISVIAISILSKAITDLLVSLWVLGLGSVIGRRVISLSMKGLPISFWENAIFSLGIGFGFYSFLIFCFSLTGLLYKGVVLSTMIFVSIILFKDMILLSKEAFKEIKNLFSFLKDGPHMGFISVLLSIILIILLINFIGAIAPETQYDSLNYHLTVPRIYIENHGLVDLPYILQSYFAKSVEMLYGLGLIISGQITAKLFSFNFGILIAGAIICFGKRFSSLETGIVAAALFYVCPLVGWLSTTTYIDLAVALYIFSAIYTLALYWRTNKQGFLILCCFMSGFALSAKLNAVLALIPIGISILVISYINSEKSFSKSLYNGMIFGIFILILAMPFYLVTYFHTGNPIFPFCNALFKSPLLPGVNTFMNLKGFGMGYDLKSFIQLPWNLTYYSESFIEGAPGGLLGIAVLIALPFIFFIWHKLSRVVKLLIFINVVVIGLWFVIGQYLRYILPIFPVLTILAAFTLLCFKGGYRFKFSNGIINIIVIVGLFATVPISLISFWNIPERIPYKVALGIESPDSYLSRVVRSYSASFYLNRHYDSNKIRVFLIAPEQRFYLKAPAEYPATSLNINRDFFKINTPEELTSYLKEKGFTHILIDTVVAPIVSKNALEKINEEFLRTRARLEFARNCVELYKIIWNEDLEKKGKPKLELIANPSFEVVKDGTPLSWLKYGTPLFDLSGKNSRTGIGSIRTGKDNLFMQIVDVKGDSLYTLRHWSKTEKDNQFARLLINWLSCEGKIIWTDIKVVPVIKNKWTSNSMSANAPSAAIKAVIYASVHEDSEVWFDDFSFVEGD